jgi:hypothetical protein
LLAAQRAVDAPLRTDQIEHLREPRLDILVASPMTFLETQRTAFALLA